MLRWGAGIARNRHQQAWHRKQQRHREESEPRRPRKEKRPARGDDTHDHQAMDVEERQEPGERPRDQKGHRLGVERPPPP